MLDLLIGLAVMVVCLVLQSAFIILGVQQYARLRLTRRNPRVLLHVLALLIVMVLLMLVSAVVQIGLWSTLFLLLGEFRSFTAALDFSAINFSSLDHGEFGISDRSRIIGAMEAANGVLMLSASMAVITAVLIDMLKNKEAARD